MCPLDMPPRGVFRWAARWRGMPGGRLRGTDHATSVGGCEQRLIRVSQAWKSPRIWLVLLKKLSWAGVRADIRLFSFPATICQSKLHVFLSNYLFIYLLIIHDTIDTILFLTTAQGIGVTQKGRHHKNGNFWITPPPISPLVTFSGYPLPPISPGKKWQTFIKESSTKNPVGSLRTVIITEIKYIFYIFMKQNKKLY